MDFFPTFDAIRPPLSLEKDMTSRLKDGESIIAMKQHTFTDSAGDIRYPKIVVSAKDSNKTRIFIDNFYTPSDQYTNRNVEGSTDIGWTDDLVEVTESYSGLTMISPSSTGNGEETFEIDNTVFEADLNDYKHNSYFRGFFLYDQVLDKNIGIITESDYSASPDKTTFYLRLNTNYTGGSSLTAGYSFNTSSLTLCRFPVNYWNRDIFSSIKAISFLESHNEIKIVCEDSRILNLQFLQDKKFFNNNTINFIEPKFNYYTDWYGFWFSFDIPDVKNKKEFQTRASTTTGESWRLLAYTRDPDNAHVHLYIDTSNILTNTEISVGDVITLAGDFTGVNTGTIVAGSYTVSSVTESRVTVANVTTTGPYYQVAPAGVITFSLGAVSGSVYVHNPNDYKELGIALSTKTDVITVGTDMDFDEVHDILVTLDGYQAIYLKRFVAISDTTLKRVIYDIDIYFNYDFDRRVTQIDVYNGREPKGTADGYLEKYAYHLPEEYFGTTLMSKEDRFDFSYNSYVSRLTPYDKGSGSEFEKDPRNTGLSSVDTLNNFIWKDVHIKCKQLIRVGEYVIAIGLSNDSVSTDADFDKNGQAKICLSQVQFGNINTSSIFVDERVHQVITSDKITAGIDTIGSQFMIFTPSDLYWLSVDNDSITQHRKYTSYGLPNSDALVRAKHQGNYAGIYWCNNTSIYRFLDDKPENILENRWEYNYVRYSTDIKENIIGGYLPRTLEVFFIFQNVIYIWNIKYTHWKKYLYPQQPIKLNTGFSDELLFSTDKIIFTTTPPSLNLWKDVNVETDNIIPLQFFFTQKIELGSKIVNKSFHLLDLVYEAVEGDVASGIINVEIGTDDSFNNVLTKSFSVNDFPTKKVIGTTFRKRGNVLNLKISSEAEFKSFKLTETNIHTKVTNRQLTKF